MQSERKYISGKSSRCCSTVRRRSMYDLAVFAYTVALPLFPAWCELVSSKHLGGTGEARRERMGRFCLRLNQQYDRCASTWEYVSQCQPMRKTQRTFSERAGSCFERTFKGNKKTRKQENNTVSAKRAFIHTEYNFKEVRLNLNVHYIWILLRTDWFHLNFWASLSLNSLCFMPVSYTHLTLPTICSV